MATEAQIKANQQNAKLSSGPSDAAKEHTKLNATKHGYTGRTIVLCESEAEPYRLFTESHHAEFAPVGPTEEHLVQAIVDNRWRSHKIFADEAALYALGQIEYAARFEDQAAELIPSLCRAFTTTAKFKEISLLNRYHARITRLLAADEAQLRQLQGIRKAKALEDFKDAVALFTISTDPHNFDPTEFGFVWTANQIVDAMYFSRAKKDARAATDVEILTVHNLPVKA
jgi:hypothetical protein